MDTIKEFLKNFGSKNTIYTYRSALNVYFGYLNVDPNIYFDNGRDYENDVKQFAQYLKERPPKTFNLHLSSVKMFLQENKIDLPNSFWRTLRRRKKGHRSVIEDDVPTNQQLKQILIHGGAKENALYLMLASSGMRIGEACQIRLNDVDPDNSPTKITIRGEYTKSGNKRHVFISNEATEALKEWLKLRKDYLKRAKRKSNFKGYTKPADDPRVFPFSPVVARLMWNRMLKEAEFTERDGTKLVQRYKLHPHSLRKFFRSRMPKALGVDITEALMGHEGYLTEIYRRYTVEELAEEYSKGMHLVAVFEAQADLSGVHEQLAEKDKQIKQLQEDLKDMERKFGNLLVDEIRKLKEKNKY